MPKQVLYKTTVDGYEKDIKNGIVQPTDREYNIFMKERNKLRREKEQEQELAVLKTDIAEIKVMLAQLIGKN